MHDCSYVNCSYVDLVGMIRCGSYRDKTPDRQMLDEGS